MHVWLHCSWRVEGSVRKMPALGSYFCPGGPEQHRCTCTSARGCAGGQDGDSQVRTCVGRCSCHFSLETDLAENEGSAPGQPGCSNLIHVPSMLGESGPHPGGVGRPLLGALNPVNTSQCGAHRAARLRRLSPSPEPCSSRHRPNAFRAPVLQHTLRKMIARPASPAHHGCTPLSAALLVTHMPPAPTQHGLASLPCQGATKTCHAADGGPPCGARHTAPAASRSRTSGDPAAPGAEHAAWTGPLPPRCAASAGPTPLRPPEAPVQAAQHRGQSRAQIGQCCQSLGCMCAIIDPHRTGLPAA